MWFVQFYPKEHKAFHRDAFLFNLSNQGTTQWVIEQLSKEDTNPSNFSPQHIKNLAKTIEQNRATGQYLSTNANTGANASVNLLCYQRTQVTQKKYQKPKGNQECSQSNQQQQSSQPSKKSCPLWKDNKGRQTFKSKGDFTWCGDFNSFPTANKCICSFLQTSVVNITIAFQTQDVLLSNKPTF